MSINTISIYKLLCTRPHILKLCNIYTNKNDTFYKRKVMGKSAHPLSNVLGNYNMISSKRQWFRIGLTNYSIKPVDGHYVRVIQNVAI